VRVVDCVDGLEFVCIGLLPERRLMLESVYGLLTVKNGVPVGYVLMSSLFEATEIAYNVFESWRGGEAGRTFGRVLAIARHLFGAHAFSIDPYQLGHDNPEGLASGAWWFYYKLGFRPEDPGVRRLVREEKRRMREDPRHRSSVATLQELSACHMFLSLVPGKRDLVANLDLGELGLSISSRLAERFGAERERGIRTMAAEAADLLGASYPRGLSRGERLAWERWSPLVLLLPGVRRWTPKQKGALAALVRAKGGRRESDFVRRFDAHGKLRNAIWKLAGGGAGRS
jgi:hypothetical protein